jgi:hypothetical protein
MVGAESQRGQSLIIVLGIVLIALLAHYTVISEFMALRKSTRV